MLYNTVILVFSVSLRQTLEASGDLGLKLEGVPRHATIADAEASTPSVEKVKLTAPPDDVAR